MANKICTKCRLELSIENFYRSRNRKSGYSTWCKSCEKEHRLVMYASRRESRITEKVCRGCATLKPISEFCKSVKNAGGYSARCRPCTAARWREKFTTDSHRVRYLYERIKSKCRKKGIPFDLSVEDIKIPKTCPIFGIPLVFGGRNGKSIPSDNSPSVDRIIPERGYVRGNILVVSQRANRIKNDATLEELKQIFEYYSRS